MLRHVIKLPVEVQSEMVQQIVQFNMTGKQVREIVEHNGQSDIGDSDEKPAPSEVRLIKVMRNIEQQAPEAFVQTLVREEKSTHLARARLQSMIAFLRQVNQLLPEENM